MNCCNYRSLKLTDQVMKVLEGVMDSAVRKMVDINKLQFSYVPERGNTDAIFVARPRTLQEKYRAADKPLYFAFIYLENAFDRAPREVLWWPFRSLGINDWAVRVNRACMPMARSRVRVNGQCIGKFNVGVDVHQGSVLNNLLSILVIEAVSHVFHTGVTGNSSTQMSLSLWQAQRWSVLGVPRP